MGGEDVGKSGQVSDHRLKVGKVPAARVGFVPHHEGRPLVVAHRTGTGIGQKIDPDLVGAELKKVVMGPDERRLSLRRFGIGDTLDYLRAVRLKWWRGPSAGSHRGLDIRQPLLYRRPGPDAGGRNCTGVASHRNVHGGCDRSTVGARRRRIFGPEFSSRHRHGAIPRPGESGHPLNAGGRSDAL